MKTRYSIGDPAALEERLSGRSDGSEEDDQRNGNLPDRVCRKLERTDHDVLLSE